MYKCYCIKSRKTTLTTALLYHYKNSVRPFKKDLILLTLFHQKICQTSSINLDTCIMNQSKVKWMFDKYSDKISLYLKGVSRIFMMVWIKNASAYDVTKLLNVPTVIVLDASGSYITISAIIKGLKNLPRGKHYKGVILIMSLQMVTFELIKNQSGKRFDDICSFGLDSK